MDPQASVSSQLFRVNMVYKKRMHWNELHSLNIYSAIACQGLERDVPPSVMADQKRFLTFWASAISTFIIELVLFPYLFCTVLPFYFHISFSQCLCQ